jgi:hypothetical protein
MVAEDPWLVGSSCKAGVDKEMRKYACHCLSIWNELRIFVADMTFLSSEILLFRNSMQLKKFRLVKRVAAITYIITLRYIIKHWRIYFRKHLLFYSTFLN